MRKSIIFNYISYFTVFCSLIFLFLPFVTTAQLGGNGIYDFLNLTNSARVTGLGGKNISIFDDDLNLAFNNPSLLNDSMSGRLTLNYSGYFADIKYGYASYSHDFKKYGTFAAGIHYINYGNFTAADETGIITGEFSAAEYAFNIIWSKRIYKMLSAGINIKPVYSHLESYTSSGVAMDLGLTYLRQKSGFSFAFVLKNVGTQLKSYYEENYEPLSFDVQLGISKILKHAPFRINVTAHHLHKWNMRYDIPKNDSDISYDDETEESGKSLQNFLDNFMRHMIFGIEFIPLKSFYVAVGYNYQRMQEMSIDEKIGFVGLTWGFGLKLRQFGISYGRASYHVAGGSNNFSLYFNFNKKRNKKLEQ